LLAVTRVSPNIDLILMSAMMSNADELAAWIEWLVGRRCLALELSWKPTRQARGCVVYKNTRIDELQRALHSSRTRARRERPNAKPRAADQ